MVRALGRYSTVVQAYQVLSAVVAAVLAAVAGERHKASSVVHDLSVPLLASSASGDGTPGKIIPCMSRVGACPYPCHATPPPIGLTAAGLFAGKEVSRLDSRVR